MSAILSGVVFAGLLGVGWVRRPLPVARRVGLSPAGGLPVATLGRIARRSVRLPADPASDATVGWALLAGIPAWFIWPGLALGVAIGAAIEPRRRRVVDERRARRAIVQELPEAIDLLRLAISASGSLPLALRAAAPGLAGPVGAAFAAVVADLEDGTRSGEALHRAMAPLGPPARPLTRALVGAADGVAIGPTLDRLSSEARREWRRAIEADVRRVPVRLLVPLVLCILPAFVILTLVPVLARTVFRLDLG